MNDLPESAVNGLPDDPVDSEDAEVRPGPLWRHALWVLAVTAAGVALGWVGALFRIGPEEFGLPPAAPGALWPYLLGWTAIGLVLSAVLRFVAAKVPVYQPEEAVIGVVLIGTRLSLGWRPEPLEVSQASPPRACCSWPSGVPSLCVGRPSYGGPRKTPASREPPRHADGGDRGTDAARGAHWGSPRIPVREGASRGTHP